MTFKNKYSLYTCILISIVLLATRLIYSPLGNGTQIKVTTWDALGYYIYLPAQYIYNDQTKLLWVDSVDKKYNISGGQFYQASKHKNGNFVFKYLKGVSHLQLPFFLIAHQYALHSKKYLPDGFSEPYQLAIAFGCLFYCIIAIFFLRNILLLFYNDASVAITLLALLLGSNFTQYVSIEAGQSHGYIFPLYVFILYATIQWHRKYTIFWIFIIGYIIGLATISRPTEAIMLFIPILWQVATWQDFKEKVIFLFKKHLQLVAGFTGIFIAIVPQLLYWKNASDSYIYDVGSKWDFLNPHFSVLFGFEKGWFIYTPITLFFVMGLFFIKSKPFSKSIIWFCILNIYIIIAWHIWRYGGSYSTRALVQSYPIFALALAGFVSTILYTRYKYIMLVLFSYLIAVNLFQIKQYNQNIIHYDDMNASYYKAIYLNNHPTAIDMSLLDGGELLNNEKKYTSGLLFLNKYATINNNDTLWQLQKTIQKNTWLKFKIDLSNIQNPWNAHFYLKDNYLQSKFRVENALFNPTSKNTFEFYKKAENTYPPNSLLLTLSGNNNFTAQDVSVTIYEFKK